MALRKLSSKRSRKDKAAEGTSSAPEYDSHRFRSAEHQQRFEAIRGWSFLRGATALGTISIPVSRRR